MFDVPLTACPPFDGKISVYLSAVATYYAPSDPSGTSGMRRERIHSRMAWRKGPARRDCALINSDPDLDGMRGLEVVRVLLFFSFEFQNKTYPCALVRWFSRIGHEPDEDTGMWRVERDFDANDEPLTSVVHLDCIVRATHLIGVYGREFIPEDLSPHESLDAFQTFYVNKFIDHHAFEIAF